MDFLKTFGFDVKLFIAQIINFLILVYLLNRFLYKPILEILKQREKKIRTGLEDAEKSRIILEQAEKEKEEILKNARIESEKIINETKLIAKEIRKSIIDSSKSESEKIILEAKNQAKLEMEKMEKKIKVLSLDLSQKILTNLIQSLFNEQEKNKILERAIDKLREKEQS
jgi:F-type H+-transporting ATPase subunit b